MPPPPASSRGRVLWTPPAARKASSHLSRFVEFVSDKRGRKFQGYDDLYQWSTEDLEAFWLSVWEYCGVVYTGKIEAVLRDPRLPGARWFEGARLNFAENLLRPQGSRPALIFESEDESLRRSITWDELRRDVSRAQAALLRLGVKEGDRVAAFTPNVPEAVVAMLASSSLGAIWSSCSPDFGPQGVLDRFGQIEPKVLFSADGYVYSGKRHALGERLQAVLRSISSIQATVVYPYSGPKVAGLRGQISWEDFLGHEKSSLASPHFAFDQPLAILYTSGTTGVPKCIVHGAGGTLLKHLEEHRLQVDLRDDDVFFYFTTCGWMMWNWLVSGLATGSAVVLYDGSPLHPDPRRLFRMIDRNGITVFGTSPRFLSAVESSGLVPRSEFSLSTLRTLISTGSPLYPAQFEWVYRALKADVHLASISGGTDLIGCFVSGSPFHPVRAGEIACRTLGMKVESLNGEGKPLVGEKGELVCSAPFPSMPVGFWKDPDGSKYQRAYFDRFPGKWHHGDFIELTEDGAAIIHGRSDATLNPGGVRIGTAEIYRAIEGLPEIRDFLAVGREARGDIRIVLFVVLAPKTALDEQLEKKIRDTIRVATSPRHVPREIYAVPEIPRTISGKSVELAVAKVLHGEAVTNKDALANPEALEHFKRFAKPGSG